MCGRFVQSGDVELYARLFEVEEPAADGPEPRFNVAPTDTTWACALGRDGRRRLDLLRWGLVPHWSKGPDARYSMINARAETVHSKPAYRDAFRRRRCLIPAEGFYEWRKRGSAKQPYFVRREDGRPMAFAGLWEHWKERDTGEVINSCAIIVTDANELMAPIHDRMPVILAPGDFGLWLDPDTDTEDLRALLQPARSGVLDAYPVSRAVNNPRNDGEELIEPVEADEG